MSEAPMIEIHLYGKLRRFAGDSSFIGDSVLCLEPLPGETSLALLQRAGIPLEELQHVFLNGTLLMTRNRMAPWLRYPQARPDVWRWDEDVEVKSGDRLGLFGEDMPSLVV